MHPATYTHLTLTWRILIVDRDHEQIFETLIRDDPSQLQRVFTATTTEITTSTTKLFFKDTIVSSGRSCTYSHNLVHSA